MENKKERELQIEMLEIQIYSSNLISLCSTVLAIIIGLIGIIFMITVTISSEEAVFKLGFMGLIAGILAVITIAIYALEFKRINRRIENLREEFL